MWRDLARRVQHEWRCDMYARIQRSQLAFLEGERTTRVARVLTEDIDQFGRFLGNQANYLVRIATTLGLVVGVFLVFAPQIAWIAFLPIPVVAWLSFYYQERVGVRLGAVGRDSSRLSGQLVNNLEAERNHQELRGRGLRGGANSTPQRVVRLQRPRRRPSYDRLRPGRPGAEHDGPGRGVPPRGPSRPGRRAPAGDLQHRRPPPSASQLPASGARRGGRAVPEDGGRPGPGPPAARPSDRTEHDRATAGCDERRGRVRVRSGDVRLLGAIGRPRRPDTAHRSEEDHRHRRRDRSREDNDRQTAATPARCEFGPSSLGRRGRPRRAAPRPARRDRFRQPGCVPVRRHDRRQHHLWDVRRR